MKNQTEQELAYILSPRHLRLLDNIFRKHNLPEFQIQILDWVQTVLADEREEWNKLRVNSVDILCCLEREEKARKRAAAKNKRYEPFKKIFKQLQEEQFRKYQRAERYYPRMLSSNGFNTIKLHL